MHCCGMLSVRAVELFEHLKADSIFLVPCCLPAKVDPRTPPEVFVTKEQSLQYWAWAGLDSDQISSKSVKIELADDGRPAPAALPGDCYGLPAPHSVVRRIQTAEN